MDVDGAIDRVLLGEPLQSIYAEQRDEMLRSVGLEPKEAASETFAKETRRFVNKVARQLGDRHPGDQRALAALHEWVLRVDDYDPWDALLSHFEFDGKELLVRRGRMLFPGPLTAHWEP